MSTEIASKEPSLSLPSRSLSAPADRLHSRSSSPNPLYSKYGSSGASGKLDISHPICEGYLFKQGHLPHVFNRRYFVLYYTHLLYYKSEGDFEHDKIKNHLSKRKMEFQTEGLYLTKPAKKPSGGRFCWVLHLPHPINHRNKILLVAKTKEERHKWMQSLQSINPHLHPHPHKDVNASPLSSPSSSPPRDTVQRSLTTDSECHEDLCVVENSSGEEEQS